jgi:hypothetical protein
MLVAQEARDRAIEMLQAKGAQDIEHVGGTLLPHLVGTAKLLQDWGNPQPLCIAGLVHTSYGTDGFNERFFDPLTQRHELAAIVGEEAEAITYFYDACDRKFLYPRVRKGEQPVRFRDRYTGREFEPEPAMYRSFLELTFANELEIFRRVKMGDEQVEKWRKFFTATESQVSSGAAAFFHATLPAAATPAAPAASKPRWKFW